MRDQRREKLRVECGRFRRAGRHGLADYRSVLHPADLHDEVRLPAARAPADMPAFNAADHALLLKERDPAVEPREIDFQRAVGVGLVRRKPERRNQRDIVAVFGHIVRIPAQ